MLTGDLLGTEGFLLKTDGPHTIGFSATYGFTPGLSCLYSLELCAAKRENSNLDALRLSERIVSEWNLP